MTTTYIRKTMLIVIVLTFVLNCSENINSKYIVNLTDFKSDLFHVSHIQTSLTEECSLYNFAATAPGIYANTDFGKYVKKFSAYDKKGDEIQTERLNTNQWKILQPEEVYRIEYDIEDSYDSDLQKPRLLGMTGTALEEDFAIFNTFGVLGYFEKRQNQPLTLELIYKKGWTAGSSLTKYEGNSINSKQNGKSTKIAYYAENYDVLADNPVLLGELTFASTKVNDIKVDVYVHTTDERFFADKMIGLTDTLLQTAADYIGFSPVSNYSFLMCLLPDSVRYAKEQLGGGALEHNRSSLYFLPSDPEELSMLKDVMVHEFLHILTPLNAHSEKIHNFNFISPEPSAHVWFYEGVTEWGSTIAQLRSGYKSLPQYLQKLSNYLRTSDTFDRDYSLYNLSLETYSEKGRREFINFYNKGAVTAALLDIKLLEMSNGKKGLRDLVIELVKEYGTERAFKDSEFFDIIVKKTYPEINVFLDEYIRNSKSFPIKDYFEKLGIEYKYEEYAESETPSLGMNFGINENREILAKGVTNASEYGIKENDIIMELFGEKINHENIMTFISKKDNMKIGDKFQIKIKRNNQEIALEGELKRFLRKHIFRPMKNPTSEQTALLSRWSKN